MNFSNPNAFWVFLLLPVLVYIGWPRLAYRRRRDTASLIIRLMLVVLLVVGLAGPQVERQSDRLAVVFVMDMSHSIDDNMRIFALNYIQDATDAMTDKDQAAVLLFGADTVVEAPMRDTLNLALTSDNRTLLPNTDLATAIQTALALYPEDAAKRMVILSDGIQTTGNAEEAARLAAANDEQIVYVPLADETAIAAGLRDVMITRVDVPNYIDPYDENCVGSDCADQIFRLTVQIATNHLTTSARLEITSGNKPIPLVPRSGSPGADRIVIEENRESGIVTLTQGSNNIFEFDILRPTTLGPVDYTVQLTPLEDNRYTPNDELSASTWVKGASRVLLLRNDELETADLRRVLEDSGLLVDEMAPSDLRIGVSPLNVYNSIVLANVSAPELGPERMAALQAFVRDLGGGLVVIGGDNSYGVGGYFETPLEETLPVEMRVRDPERIPQTTVLFVIDRSGSMQMASSSSVANLELAKEAVVRSINLMDDDDKVGVFSFDTSTDFVVEIQELGDEANREQIRERVGALRSGGGTNIYQGMLAADRELSEDDSAIKHIILLTDGGESNQNAVIDLAGRIFDNYTITTSVVAVDRANEVFLNDVATNGRGTYVLTDRPSNIPAIFTSEMFRITDSYVYEENFEPEVVLPSHPILAGIGPFDPELPLKGYVVTAEKDPFNVIMRGPEGDPILAAWQYGLGRSGAFTSDATNDRWGEYWVEWDDYARFWTQVVQWSIIEGNVVGEGTSAGYIPQIAVIEEGDQAVLVMEAWDMDGGYQNGLNLNATVLNAQDVSETFALDMQQTAPGRYEATFSPQDTGTYLISIKDTPDAVPDAPLPPPFIHRDSWVRDYSAEYRLNLDGQVIDTGLLSRVATITGGQAVSAQPAAVFVHDLDQARAADPIWYYFLLVGLLLLPLDVAVRRLVLTRRDMEQVQRSIAGWLGRDGESTYATSTTAARLDKLKDAKARARPTATPSEQADEPASHPQPGPRPSRPPTVDRAWQKKPAEAERGGSLASRLLESRQALRENEQREDD
ncbi:MAG: VWA domain-containing protein [Chloroflexi bacterium]|nr:VWA domain-containing protein [Chloroflexota bacterium]